MKRQLTVALGLAVIATPALATKARMEALGEDSFGSYYIQDNRNIFLNPARITENKDFVTYEFGQGGDVTAVDSASSPRAGGGFAKSHGNMVYGLHFGDSSPSTGALRGLVNGPTGAGTANLQEQQPWDLHVGGDAGLKWGASLTYEQFDGTVGAAGARLASNGLRLRGGVLMGDLDLFAHVSLKNEAKDFAGNSMEGDMGLFFGAGYMLNNYKLFADYRMIGAEYRSTAAGMNTTKEDIDNTILRVGAGRQERLNDRATLFAKAMITRQTVDDEGNGTLGAEGEVTALALPVTVGLEYAATSWLDLRASVINNVFSQVEVDPKAGSKTSEHANVTSVRAGASLKFGEFSVDGLIATNDGSGVGANADGSTDSGGVIRTDSLLTRVSMIYRF
ncbi:MAG: outer membrane beta-barrel protein [Bdellovibrionota bacterium]